MQDISLFCGWQRVDRSPELKGFAEIEAADLVPSTLGRRLCIIGRYVGAVLTASFSPVAPIQSIETEVSAFLNMKAVPRGLRSFRCVRKTARRLSLLPAHTGETELPLGHTRREEKAEVCSFSSCGVRWTPYEVAL